MKNINVNIETGTVTGDTLYLFDSVTVTYVNSSCVFTGKTMKLRIMWSGFEFLTTDAFTISTDGNTAAVTFSLNSIALKNAFSFLPAAGSRNFTFSMIYPNVQQSGFDFSSLIFNNATTSEVPFTQADKTKLDNSISPSNTGTAGQVPTKTDTDVKWQDPGSLYWQE